MAGIGETWYVTVGITLSKTALVYSTLYLAERSDLSKEYDTPPF